MGAGDEFPRRAEEPGRLVRGEPELGAGDWDGVGKHASPGQRLFCGDGQEWLEVLRLRLEFRARKYELPRLAFAQDDGLLFEDCEVTRPPLGQRRLPRRRN